MIRLYARKRAPFIPDKEPSLDMTLQTKEPSVEGSTIPSNHYIDNKALYAAIVTYRNECTLAKLEGRPRPRMPEYIGGCILKIATRLSRSHNFIKYPFREDMISDGVENALLYFDSFNPEKSKNPFSYFTQGIYFAFLKRIYEERKEMYVKYKSMREHIDEGVASFGEQDSGDEFEIGGDDNNEFINDFVKRFEESLAKRREKRVPKPKKGVEIFMEDDAEDVTAALDDAVPPEQTEMNLQNG